MTDKTTDTWWFFPVCLCTIAILLAFIIIVIGIKF